MYIEIIFEKVSDSVKEIIIATLSPFTEGFEEGNDFLKAFFKKENFDVTVINDILKTYSLQYRKNEIQAQNWNAVWESNFEPVIVDDFVAVRADFHEPIANVTHEIVITPKMSFGTGHHATTYLMLQLMRSIDFQGKSVFDFGTGTGILTIMAAKLGAAKIIATDIDEWAIKNAEENFVRNNITNVSLLHTSEETQGGNFDVILANINKNVLMQTIPQLLLQLNSSGILALSGLLIDDEEDILKICKKVGVKNIEKNEKMGWICLKMNRL